MLYRIVCFILLVFSKIFYRVKVSGAENIPQDGSFIVCSNHIHSWDPALIAINTNRKIRFMAKKELFERRIAWFFKAMGAFPVNRNSADMTSYRVAMNTLATGGGLGVFCQGTRMQELDIKGAKGGVALFGVKSKAPIIPVGISGSYRFFSTLKINFGKPITLEKHYGSRLTAETIEEIMSGIMTEVEKLIDDR